MRGLFVTGTDTDAGKTLVCAALMAGAPPEWRYWKPVQTGLDSDPGDTATVQHRARLTADRVLDLGVRLGLPASPHHAAHVAGTHVDMAALVDLAHTHAGTTPWVVEGAGGLLVPLDDRTLQSDLIAALDLPVLIVVRVRLGAINHALLTERALATHGLRGLGLVLSGPDDPSLTTALAAHARLPVLAHVPELAADADLTDVGRAIHHALADHRGRR